MKTIKIILVATFFIALVSSCGRKDRCPSVHKGNKVQQTQVA